MTHYMDCNLKLSTSRVSKRSVNVSNLAKTSGWANSQRIGSLPSLKYSGNLVRYSSYCSLKNLRTFTAECSLVTASSGSSLKSSPGSRNVTPYYCSVKERKAWMFVQLDLEQRKYCDINYKILHLKVNSNVLAYAWKSSKMVSLSNFIFWQNILWTESLL